MKYYVVEDINEIEKNEKIIDIYHVTKNKTEYVVQKELTPIEKELDKLIDEYYISAPIKKFDIIMAYSKSDLLKEIKKKLEDEWRIISEEIQTIDYDGVEIYYIEIGIPNLKLLSKI